MPGPQGHQGDIGPQGPKGDAAVWYVSESLSFNGNPGDLCLQPSTGNVYKYTTSSGWGTAVANIKGPQGNPGATGPTGATGPIGPTGLKGDKGDPATPFLIVGTLQSVSELPAPTSVPRNSAYNIVVDGVNHIYAIQGPEGSQNIEWIDLGPVSQGPKGPEGAKGVGIDDLKSADLSYGNTTATYDTTNGISLATTGRFTYGDNNITHDANINLDVPLIAGNGISMNADATNSKVNIKVDDSKIPYYPKGVANAKVLIRSGDMWSVIPYANYVIGNSIVCRTPEGRIRAAEPTEHYDCTTKKYVDDAVASVSTEIWAPDSTGVDYHNFVADPTKK